MGFAVLSLKEYSLHCAGLVDPVVAVVIPVPHDVQLSALPIAVLYSPSRHGSQLVVFL